MGHFVYLKDIIKKYLVEQCTREMAVNNFCFNTLKSLSILQLFEGHMKIQFYKLQT